MFRSLNLTYPRLVRFARLVTAIVLGLGISFVSDQSLASGQRQTTGDKDQTAQQADKDGSDSKKQREEEQREEEQRYRQLRSEYWKIVVKLYDEDNDGMISGDEFPEITQRIRDANGDAAISRLEFMDSKREWQSRKIDLRLPADDASGSDRRNLLRKPQSRTWSKPAKEANASLDDDRPKLGVTLDTSGANNGLGIKLNQVAKDGPAEGAGLRVGDVLTSINEDKTTNLAELRSALAKRRLGDSVAVRYLRKGEELTLTMKLGGEDGSLSVKVSELENGQIVLAGDKEDVIKTRQTIERLLAGRNQSQQNLLGLTGKVDVTVADNGQISIFGNPSDIANVKAMVDGMARAAEGTRISGTGQSGNEVTSRMKGTVKILPETQQEKEDGATRRRSERDRYEVYAKQLMNRYDRDENGFLDGGESRVMRKPPNFEKADTNRDKFLDFNELASYYQPKSDRRITGITSSGSAAGLLDDSAIHSKLRSITAKVWIVQVTGEIDVNVDSLNGKSAKEVSKSIQRMTQSGNIKSDSLNLSGKSGKDISLTSERIVPKVDGITNSRQGVHKNINDVSVGVIFNAKPKIVDQGVELDFEVSKSVVQDSETAIFESDDEVVYASEVLQMKFEATAQCMNGQSIAYSCNQSGKQWWVIVVAN